jgi:steroid 5-alpha reductase family enzyme
VLTYINNQMHKVTILVICIHQSFLQYILFHSIWAIKRETERNSGLGSCWSSFCGTLSLISQLIYDDIAKMFHLTAGNG